MTRKLKVPFVPPSLSLSLSLARCEMGANETAAGSHGTLSLSLSFKAPSLNFELWMPAAAARLTTTTRKKKKALLFLPHFHALRYCHALQGREQASQAFYFLFHFYLSLFAIEPRDIARRRAVESLTSYPAHD